jgi:hypothetical protein
MGIRLHPKLAAVVDADELLGGAFFDIAGIPHASSSEMILLC